MKHTAQSVHDLLQYWCDLLFDGTESVPTPQEIEDIGKREALRLLIKADGRRDCEPWTTYYERIFGVRLEEEDHD